MTNGVDAKAVPVYGGFIGVFKKVHRSTWEKVCEGGVPRVFDTEPEAEVAAWRALLAHLQGEIVGSGIEKSAARSKAEELFGKIFPGKGRKPIDVVRR